MIHDEIPILQFARLVLDAIEAAGIDYLIGGSLALIAWGQPRTTEDVDVLIELPGNRIRLLSQELEKRQMLVPADILLDLLLLTEGDLPANAIHLDSGYKAELFLLRPDDSFGASALSRRRLIDLGNPLGMVYVHAPEDLILNKTRYYSLSQQTKHIRDIASILVISGDEIDWEYLNHWIDRLALTPIWWELLREVDELLARGKSQQGAHA